MKEQLVEEIEQLRQEVAELRQVEEKYRTIIENIVEAYYEVDLAGNFTLVNDVICDNMGYST